MKKKLLVMLLVVAMIVSSFAACGEKKEDASNDDTKTEDTAKKGDDAKTDEVKAPAKGTGKTLRIACWNDEFQKRLEKYYPDFKDGKIGDVKVEYVMTPSDNGAYQNKLDEDLLKQADAADEEKIDMFLIEADYALKYVNTDYAMDVKDLGITDADTANMYQYTKDICTDGDGKLKALSWQATPGLFIYRRSMAKEVFGTDDPAKMQEELADWDKFDAAAEKVCASGKYKMLSGYDDSYRTFSNNVSGKWVDADNKIVIDDNLTKWIDQTKKYTDAGYNNKTSLWDDAWKAGQSPKGNVFGYFYSTWGIAFTLRDFSLETPEKEGGKLEVGNGIFGDWAACKGPSSYYWGGTWICGATGTDNADLVADIMKKLTCDKEIMKSITKGEDDYTNNKEAIKEIIADGYSSAFLGGQDHMSLLADAADKIDMSKTSPYDQGLNESLQGAMKDYYDGKVDKDKALDNFYKKALEKYPNLSK